MLTTQDIAAHVRSILHEAASGEYACFLSAYQLLERMPADLRQQLIDERGEPGEGGGHPYSAAKLVSQAARNLGAEVVYLDVKGMTFTVNDRTFAGGYPYLGLYRLQG